MITLSQLAIYPIKSCAQIALHKADISPFGLAMDRRWMLVDENGTMLTQRKHPRLCLIQPELNNRALRIQAPDMPVLQVPEINTRDNTLLETTASVWNDSCRAIDCGEAAARWFSDFLGISARLVFFPDNEERQVDLNYARKGDKTAFSDGFPYLLISQESLDDLNNRLDTPVEMKRFRPNLVVRGATAFAEDQWQKIRMGEVSFRLVKPCSRCIIPSINPATAEKTTEPLKTLSGYRMRDNKIFFGQNVIAEGSGRLETGMQVEVLE